VIHGHYGTGARVASSFAGCSAGPGKGSIRNAEAVCRGSDAAVVGLHPPFEHVRSLYKGLRASWKGFYGLPTRWCRNKRPFFVDLCMAADRLAESGE